MQRRRDLPVAHLQDDLGQPGDACRRFAVADVRFRRTDQAETGVGSVLTKCLAQRSDLDRIAQLGTSAVCFDVADVTRINARILQRIGNHCRLRLRIGHRVAVGLAAVVQRAAADHRMDRVAVALGVGQALQHHHAHAFTRNIAVAAFAETLAMAVAGNELAGAEHGVLARMQTEVDAASQRHVGAAQLQVLAGEMDRGQRRRAHGVERHAWPVHVEHVGQAVGDAGEAARAVVFAVHHPGIHAHLPAATGLQRGAGIARVLDGHPRVLQEHALLRVDLFGVARRDAEKAGIEFVGALDESAPAAAVLSGGQRFAADRVGAVRSTIVVLPAPAVGRDFADAVHALRQVAPVFVQIPGLRIAAADANDGDAFAVEGWAEDGLLVDGWLIDACHRDRRVRAAHVGVASRWKRSVLRLGVRLRPDGVGHPTRRTDALAGHPRCRGRCNRCSCGPCSCGCRGGIGRGVHGHGGARRQQRNQPIRVRGAEIVVELRDGLVLERQRLRQPAEDRFEVRHQLHRQD